MPFSLRLPLLSLLLCAGMTDSFSQTDPKKPLRRASLRRADSFFGLHFDFHAGITDTLIGRTLTEGMIDSLLTLVRPDFIQIDSKGHPGVSSYPTKVGNKPKTFVKDPLRLFRDVTRRHGVALYVHHSGVWDEQAVLHHPNWARLGPDGKWDQRRVSLRSAYADSLLIPQLKEISDYGVDGVWVDGECWAVEPDYRPDVLAAFQQETGLSDIPKKKDDPHYDDFLDFHRRAFKRYVTHYVDALHRYNPQFQLASNWAFSSFMPEPVTVPVDFLSGDTDPLDGANRSAFQARCLAAQGKPWDLMSWSFGLSWDERLHSPKPAVQLCQEAAQVLAMGGGFQAYWTQNDDASLKPWQFQTMADLARFCRARQAFCHQATPIPQVALLYSTTGWRARSTGVYQFSADRLGSLIGTMNALLYNQLPTEVLSEHHLRGRMGQYPLIVIPEWETLDETFRQELIQYVRDGGNLLVIGTETTRLFERELGVKTADAVRPAAFFGTDQTATGTASSYRPFEPLTGTRVVGGVYRSDDVRLRTGPAASVAVLGKGRIAGVYVNAGTDFYKRETYINREFIGSLVRQLFTPSVTVSGSQFVHVALNRKGGKTMLNLINMAGQHGDKHVHSTAEIPSIGPLTVTYQTAGKPTKVTLQPEGKPLSYQYKNNKISFILPKLDIHSVVVIE